VDHVSHGVAGREGLAAREAAIGGQTGKTLTCYRAP
jgi:hypothetical protein